MKTKFIILLLAASLLAACGGGSGATDSEQNDSQQNDSQPITSTSLPDVVVDDSGSQIDNSQNSNTPSYDGLVSGRVDSSLIERNGLNQVYIFSGNVTPDDKDGDSGDPLLTVTVFQDSNACTWGYDINTLSAGEYTLAYTSQASSDNANSDDSIIFSQVKNITVGVTNLTADFTVANILRVGPGRTYSKPSEAATIAQNGDVIEIDAGIYLNDFVVWGNNNLTLRGVGGRAHIQGTQNIDNGKGLWLMYGNNITVENVEFSGARVVDQNGAGIRGDASGLNVCNGYFHDNENGILGGAGEVLVEYSEFNHNGLGEYGRTHNMYIDPATTKFTLRYSYTHHATIGHNVKSRAASNYILYNRIMDETDGNSSYAVDIPNGGLTYIIGNLIQQGTNTDNSIMVNYGAEGLSSGRTHHLYMVNNTLVNDRGTGTFLSISTGTTIAKVLNNIFLGGGTSVSGSADLITNLVTNDAGLLDASGFDYQLIASSAAIDSGTSPGSADGFSLEPVYQYRQNSQHQLRANSNSIDIGAYEYTSQ